MSKLKEKSSDNVLCTVSLNVDPLVLVYFVDSSLGNESDFSIDFWVIVLGPRSYEYKPARLASRLVGDSDLRRWYSL